jgi:hypothetical protein
MLKLKLNLTYLKFEILRNLTKFCIIKESQPFTIDRIVKEDEAIIDVAQGDSKFQFIYFNAEYETHG